MHSLLPTRTFRVSVCLDQPFGKTHLLPPKALIQRQAPAGKMEGEGMT